MAKRKVKFDFTPSKYQEDFFDFIENGTGNAVIEAYAGSGKTSTVVNSMKLIPKTSKCLFIAFNKSIADELGEKLKSRTNCQARTLHGLGLLMLKRNLGSNIEIDEYKYRKYLKGNLSELITSFNNFEKKSEIEEYIERISSLIGFARYNLVSVANDINEIADNYGIPVSYDECFVTEKCLQWGKVNTETIDYTDMIWLPNELDLSPIGLTYDFVYIDEAQDLSKASIGLFRKCVKPNGRTVAVGDKKQSIYTFAGASEEAFDDIKNYPNTKVFKLPISYRCAKNIVTYSNTFVPDMEARENAPDGEIVNNSHIKDIKSGDMVLARTKAPLFKLYVKFLRKNINCYIKGQDIGRNLINTLEKVKEDELNVKLDKVGVFSVLYDKLFEDRNKIIVDKGLDYDDATLSSYIMDKYDEITALTIIAEKCKTKTQLISKIYNIFDEANGGICLSTIHKAKGLEADNVYILCNSTMPSKLATKKWEIEQERNLMYVAYTRPKNKLCFVSEKEISPMGAGQDSSQIISELELYERKVCKLLGKEPMERLENADLARFKLQNMTEISELDDDKEDMKAFETTQEEDELLSELEDLLDD